jgi:hypothetical protein
MMDQEMGASRHHGSSEHLLEFSRTVEAAEGRRSVAHGAGGRAVGSAAGLCRAWDAGPGI